MTADPDSCACMVLPSQGLRCGVFKEVEHLGVSRQRPMMSHVWKLSYVYATLAESHCLSYQLSYPRYVGASLGHLRDMQDAEFKHLGKRILSSFRIIPWHINLKY